MAPERLPVRVKVRVRLWALGSCSCFYCTTETNEVVLFEQQYNTTLSLDTETKQILEYSWPKLQHGRIVFKTTDLDPPPYPVEFPIPHGKSRRLYLYDAAGERFGSQTWEKPPPYEEHYRLTDALFFMIDPFALPLYRHLHHQEIERIHARLRPTARDVMDLYGWMQEMLEVSFGKPESGYSQPIAVVVGKVDALNLENEIGQPAAQILMRHNPLIRSEEDAISFLVRNFLISYGLNQLVQVVNWAKHAKFLR